MKILAVDDDYTARNLLKEALAHCGFTNVTTCPSASKALELLLREEPRFDCLLFDIEMPGMTGIDLCVETRKIKAYRRTPIIMVTGLAQRIYVDKAFASGATDYITKPFDPLEISARVRLAAELSDEQRYTEQSNDVIEMLVDELDKVTRHALDYPVEIENVARVLSYPAFENYQFELARGVFHLSSAFAVRIADIEDIHARVPPLEFKRMLCFAAKAIIAPLQAYDVFVTYRGNGVFVGNVPHNGSQALKAIGPTVQLDLSAIDCDLPPEMPQTINLVYGKPVVAKPFTRPGSARNIRAAIDNAEYQLRQLDKSDLTPTTKTPDPFSRSSNAKEEKRLEELEPELREEYEQLLRHSLDQQDMKNFPRASDHIAT